MPGAERPIRFLPDVVRVPVASGEMVPLVWRLDARYDTNLDRWRGVDGPIGWPVAVEIGLQEALDGAADGAMPAAADLDFHPADDLRLDFQHCGELPD
jgi:hypothetical protein